MTDHGPTGLGAFFAPRSIAVIGASNDPGRIGGRPVDFCKAAGFAGPIYPVNPTRDEVQGLKAWPDIESIPGEVDLAVMAVPSARAAETLEACGRKGVRAVVVFSAGFSEVGAEGAAEQARLLEIARRHGMRMLGPNCLGFYSAASGACATFSTGLEGGMPRPGRIGLITQSGAYGTHLLSMAKARRLGVAGWVSTGNEADVSVADCLDHMVNSDEVGAIGLYMEGVNDVETLIRALKRARELRKPVTIMKVGASEVGARAVQSHTASLAGSDASFQAVIEQFGAVRARTTEELFDCLYAATTGPMPTGDKLGILTVSGGAGVLMADAAEAFGLQVPPMPDASVAKLLERNPFAAPRNPVDITAHALNDFDLIPEYLAEMMRAGGYDAYAAFFTSWTGSPVLGPRLRKVLLETLKGSDRPFALIGLFDEEQAVSYETEGVLTFADPSRAVQSLATMARLARGFDAAAAQGELPDVGDPVIAATGMGEAAAKARLAQAGIPALPEEVAPTAADAARIAGGMGFPVVLKIVSPQIAHKTEVGGVALNLPDAASVEAEAARMLRDIPAKVPGAVIEGVLVSSMAGEGVELIVGTHRDPSMGPMVMVGLGGILAEVLKDVALARAPVTVAEALAMLSRLRGAPLLDGVRGRPGVDKHAVAEVIARLSVLAAANAGTIESIEINPLLARPDGAVALDALILPVKGADNG
ncbi:CoA-binding protein [Pseudooceanicola sp. 216_PA32_1]|uniref:CoA-binding protein n=1 Tax=Pseudooceanicola pacificus TaxID=2676438 RepID=A0A844WEY6_9RHOB|nr:acetate--CoA ligase family protein [Pseudooceanicola pacificus]MWB78750.1 CoA-binding protein [Pseudooceanicola pacificus]